MGVSYGSDLVFGIHYSVEEIYNFFSEDENWSVDDLNKILLNEFFVDGVKFYAELNPFDNHNAIEYYLGMELLIPILKEKPNYNILKNVIREEINAISRHITGFEYKEPDIYDIPYFI